MRLLVLALLLAAPAFALTPLDAHEMEADLLIKNTVRFDPEGGAYRMEEATGRLSWWPREDPLQEILSITTAPEAVKSGEQYVFRWERPGPQEDLALAARIETRNAIVPVHRKVPFPLEDIPREERRYLDSYEITDQSESIQRLAQELAAGKDDAYEVVYSFADWTTRNVEYSLQSLGQPAIQRASQVLASRQGKCDELTALFISLNRAAGIPARFVAGYSYTENGGPRWGGHGWAEVWFPEVGWVPFDVTYGEYGYLDAGHVKLKVSPDAKETSIEYSARGVDFSLKTEPLDISVAPVRLVPAQESGLSISLDAPYRKVGFGSTILILATIENAHPYYVATRLDLSQTSATSMLSDNYQNVLLKPRATRVVPFLLRLDEDLESGYRYEFPFEVRTRLGERSSIVIDAAEHYPVYDKQGLEIPPEDIPDVPFTIFCEQQAPVYSGERAAHTCTVEGVSGDTVEICSDECERLALEDGRFVLLRNETGVAAITARIAGRESRFFVATSMVEPLTFAIDLSAPHAVEMEETFVLFANVSGNAPEGTATLHVGREEAREHLSGLPTQLQFAVPASALRPGKNELTLTIDARDALAKDYSHSQAIEVTLVNVSFWHRLRFLLDDAGHALSGLFR